MGRPPCCDKVGIKKGPWTPEEDIILVSYIQEHGPGNWSAVPTNTGLMRCSKSCRLRWTNYLRPGIKRGNFTSHEEGMIIHLQALLGNKWAAIASYLPQRTDNDIKNYWNTHLKKKLKKLQSSVEPQRANMSVENSSMYASSADNISRLMQNWIASSSSSSNNMSNAPNLDAFYRDFGKIPNEFCGFPSTMQWYRPQESEEHGGNAMKMEEMERVLPILDHGLLSYERSGFVDQENVHFVHDEKVKIGSDPPLSFLEKWLMEENGGQVEGDMGVLPMFG